MDAIDFAKTHKDLYTATTKSQKVVAEEASFLAVDGQGAPGSEAFQKAVEAVFNVVYTLKFTLKFAGAIDFKVSKLESL